MITFQIDSINDIRIEIASFLEKAWEETVDHKELLTYGEDTVNWESYSTLEDEGILHIITIRDSGILVGYNFLLIITHPHYKVLHTVSDMMWIRESHRGIGLGRRLIQFSEDYLSNLGGGVMAYNFKVGKARPNMKSMGYIHNEEVFTKVIG